MYLIYFFYYKQKTTDYNSFTLESSKIKILNYMSSILIQIVLTTLIFIKYLKLQGKDIL